MGHIKRHEQKLKMKSSKPIKIRRKKISETTKSKTH